MHDLQVLQNKAAKVILDLPNYASFPMLSSVFKLHFPRRLFYFIYLFFPNLKSSSGGKPGGGLGLYILHLISVLCIHPDF